MPFYEICGFILSIATLLLITLISHSIITKNSQYTPIIFAAYMGIVMFVFIVGLSKVIFYK